MVQIFFDRVENVGKKKGRKCVCGGGRGENVFLRDFKIFPQGSVTEDHTVKHECFSI